ncbi:MAG TPA: CusA/CzcA family heavy metal efflux RND transporter [Pirellulaceae bacterium]|nr:CusA/CzcA family heavy metal efflux RND transporter [Pirellulaceae bacterium]
MLTALIDLSLNNRFLVIALFCLLAIGGAYSATQIPIDAVPDMTNTQVQVLTEAPGLSPIEVERLVTNRVENAMAGLPELTELRSTSKFGISAVTLVFHENTDIYRARQLVNERITQVQGELLPGHGPPELGVLATALGEVLQFEVRSRGPGGRPVRDAMALRSILEWQIAPQLRQVPGITEINSIGGYYQTFEVQLDPNRMASQRIGLEEVLAALPRNNASSGGGYIVHEDEQRFIRVDALLRDIAEIEQVVVKSSDEGASLRVKDVADVVVAPLTRQGAATRDGRGEIVTGMVIMLLGENSRTVVHRAKERLREIQETLPADVKLEILYDRADLIQRTLHTVVHNLLEGGVLVIVVLLVLLGSWRAGLIVALAIPLAMLFASNVMLATGITASLMSLGAIDFGLIVDSSVIMIENCIRRIAHNASGRSHWQVVRDAALEVRQPTMFGELIIAVVYLPILTLQGTEGKLFRPMALTVLFALAGSMLLSLTLMPVLAYAALPRRMNEREVWLLRLVKRLYRPLVEWALAWPAATALAAVLTVAASLPVALRLGAEFMPKLDEGDILIEANRLPSSTLEGSAAISRQIEELLLRFPEVKTVFCKTGRPEIANDLMGVQQTDVWVMLKPEKEWPRRKTRDELIEEMAAVLNGQVPGAAFVFTQPIEMRVDELVAGVKADVAVLLYGDDLQILAEKGKEIERVLRGVRGAVDVKADYQANVSTLSIVPRRSQLARYGLDAQAILDAVTAVGGYQVGHIFEGRARYPLIVRYPLSWREDAQRLAQLPVHIHGEQIVPLGELAEIVLEETPPAIEHEAGRRRTFVQANVRGRDVASFVQEAQQRVKSQVKLPTGYRVEWGGDFENLRSASLRLAIITPLVLLLILLLLFTSLQSARLAALIFLAVPMAASGGIFALWLRGMPFSISAGVGFIALFGVAVLNGLVWVSGAEHLRAAGRAPRDAAQETAETRLRPILMTALVASLGFLPMATSTTAGAEIQRPLATVVIGGLVTSTLLTALVIPAIYAWFAPRSPLPLGEG